MFMYAFSVNSIFFSSKPLFFCFFGSFSQIWMANWNTDSVLTLVLILGTQDIQVLSACFKYYCLNLRLSVWEIILLSRIVKVEPWLDPLVQSHFALYVDTRVYNLLKCDKSCTKIIELHKDWATHIQMYDKCEYVNCCCCFIPHPPFIDAVTIDILKLSEHFLSPQENLFALIAIPVLTN